MATKKEISGEVAELKKELGENKLVFGTKETLNDLREDGLSKVYLAKNCPSAVQGEVSRYGQLLKVPVVILDKTNEEIGMLCKKHYLISVVGVKKK